jgi:hypothetical protein
MIRRTHLEALRRVALGTLAMTAALLPIRSASAQPTDVCVAMENSDGQIAGIQLEMKWDGSCMSADLGGDNKPKCNADPNTGKDVLANLRAGPTLLALMFSMSNTSPMPDGPLFCCDFTYLKPGGGCCGLSVGRVLGSDPAGRQDASFTLVTTVGGYACTESPAELPAARGPAAPRAPAGGGAPPAVSVPGAPAAPAAPGQVPAAPAGQAPAGRAPFGPPGVPPQQVPEQYQEPPAVEAPIQRPTERPTEVTTPYLVPTRRTPAGSPTAKARVTAAKGSPTAAAATTPSPAATPAATRGATRAATPKASPAKPGAGAQRDPSAPPVTSVREWLSRLAGIFLGTSEQTSALAAPSSMAP